jgi:GTP-binding protein LepA
VYDEFKGVIAYIKVVDGQLKKHDNIRFFQNNITSEVTDIGYFSPFLVPSDILTTGEIGYVITGIKDIRQCRVGDTITISQKSKVKSQKYEEVEALPGYKLPKPMVFFGVYPKESRDFVLLRESLSKLTLNDTALTYTEEYSSYLGSGFRIGFLGLLHAEIVKERLKQEFGLDILLAMPQVLYKKSFDGVYPELSRGDQDKSAMLEPYMRLSVYTPKNYVGTLMTVCQARKGLLFDLSYRDNYVVLSYDMPYSMFIRGLSSELKAASNGFASIDYKLTEYREADLASLEVRVNDNPIDVLSEIIYKDEAIHVAREKALQLKNSLSRQQFRQIIQVVVDGNIQAREEIPPFRKDVLQKMSGGDRTRKDKLLEAQKKGKSRLISHAKISIPQEALLSMIEGG